MSDRQVRKRSTRTAIRPKTTATYDEDLTSVDPHEGVRAVTISRMKDSVREQVDDLVAVEEPMEIQLIYGKRENRVRRPISVTMRTPGNDQELAAGFLFTEGVIRDPLDILSVRVSPSEAVTRDDSVPVGAGRHNTVYVELADDVEINLATLERNFYTTSSCGICGKASLLALRSVCPPRVRNDFMFCADLVYSLPTKLREGQQVFAVTGGLHGAGLFRADGELLLLREDVGRHNAVDKLIGTKFLADEIPLRESILMLSGRASFELLQKAVMAGVPVVIAVGAPSSLAVAVAREFDVTLIAFLRGQRFNIYNGASRMIAVSQNVEA